MRPDTNADRLVGRRQLLEGVASGSLLLAGCVGDNDRSESEPEQEDNETVDPRLQLEEVTLSSAFVIELVDPDSGEQLTTVHWHGKYSHWHFGPLEITYETVRTVEVVFNDRDLNKVPLGSDETYQVGVQRSAETPADLFEIGIDGSLVDIHAPSRGEGELVFHLRNGNKSVWTSPALPVVVE
jgi:hypothetical protein